MCTLFPTICSPRFWALCNTCVVSRHLTVSSCHRKHNTRRPRVASSSGSATDAKRKALRDSAQQLVASTNRKKWEEMNANLEARVGRIPKTNVYYSPDFELKLLSLTEALSGIRETAQPEMYDCLDNPLRVKFTLNMRTAKKTKFIQKLEAHLILPHLLDFLPKRRVVALCKDAAEAALALERGAFVAGTEDIFARFEHGGFHREEFDVIVAHERWEPTINKLRNVLKERLPTRKNEQLGEDTLQMVTKFFEGVHLESSRLDGVPEISLIDTIIGQPSWDDDRLRENLQAYFAAIEENKSSRVVGSSIISAELYCPPTDEVFPLDCSPFVSETSADRQTPTPNTEPDSELADQTETVEGTEAAV